MKVRARDEEANQSQQNVLVKALQGFDSRKINSPCNTQNRIAVFASSRIHKIFGDMAATAGTE